MSKPAATHRRGASGGVLCGSTTWRVAARPEDAPTCKRCAQLDGKSGRVDVGTGKPHLLGYARVSRTDQDLASQVRQLEDAGCGRIYQEHVSGVSSSRPQWARLLEDARPGDVVVVVRLDRIGRRMGEVVASVHGLLARNIHLRTLAQPLDTTQATLAPLLLGVFSALAESEHAQLVERTHEGLAAARAMGRLGGRQRRITDAVVAQMRHLRSQGFSMSQIGHAVKLDKSSVSRALRRPLQDDPRQVKMFP